MMGDRVHCHIIHRCTHRMGVMRRYYNDSLRKWSFLRDVFLLSAFPIFNKKASQPRSVKSSNCLLLARLLSTRGHPLSSCKKGTRVSKMSALQRVGGEVRNVHVSVYGCVMYVSTCVCICMCVWYNMHTCVLTLDSRTRIQNSKELPNDNES